MDTKILIVDDHRLVRQGVRSLLEVQLGLTVVGEGADGVEGIELAAELSPDLILMDICMPRLAGIEATRRIKIANASGKVLMLTMLQGASYVEEALRVGAAGYVTKNAHPSELLTAIEAVIAGKCHVPPDFVQGLVHSLSGTAGGILSTGFTLSKREVEVLQLIADGYSSREIAKTLNRSHKTVATHRANIMQKLDVHKVAGLVRHAIRAGLVAP